MALSHSSRDSDFSSLFSLQFHGQAGKWTCCLAVSRDDLDHDEGTMGTQEVPVVLASNGLYRQRSYFSRLVRTLDFSVDPRPGFAADWGRGHRNHSCVPSFSRKVEDSLNPLITAVQAPP